jgi:mannonate dehydratase
MAPITIRAVRPILTMPDGVNRLCVVKVETSEPGLHGIGCATFTQRPLAVRTVVSEYLAPFLLGKDVQRIEELWQTMSVSGYWRNGPEFNNALSGVDMALWDIKGKLAGLPLYQLLGGKCREAAAIYRHADGRDPAQVADRVRAWTEEGVRHVRCQLGGYGGRGPLPGAPDGALPGAYFDPAGYARAVPELFAHLRGELGYEVELIHDVHERLAPAAVVVLARRLEEYGLFYLEDPLPPEQSGWLERLRGQSATPIAMGELFNHPHEWVPLISARLIDFIRCHLSQLGGITPARKLAALAEAFGVRTAWHGPRDTSPVGHAAGLHLELASPNFGIHEWSGFPEQVYEVFDGCPRERQGYLYPDDERPGLGVEIDERLAAKYPCDDTLPAWTLARTPDGSAARP